MTMIRIHPGKISRSVLLLAILLLLPLSACTRHEGRPIPEAAILTLKVGQTTEKEVLQKFGPPESKEKLLGDEIWVYRHVVHKGFATVGTSIHKLTLRFDARGILQDVDQKKHEYQSLF